MSRKLDAALAVALGREIEWKRKVKTGGRRIKPTYTYYPCSSTDKFAQLFYAGINVEVPRFSKDGNAMLELDAIMRARGYHIEDMWYQHHEEASDHGWYVLYVGHKQGLECGSATGIATMPFAVALAAYHALTGKEWVEPVNP